MLTPMATPNEPYVQSLLAGYDQLLEAMRRLLVLSERLVDRATNGPSLTADEVRDAQHELTIARAGIERLDTLLVLFRQHLTGISDDERSALIELCRAAVTAFKQKRGGDIWEHRRPGLGLVPGRVRYETLKRAAFRCELCGISADERALDVDHIVPKSVGGTDDAENLQALCWLCNTNKGSGDDATFAT
jgi:5-methylcytosine-specific restriction endonuclease McrA